MADESNNPENAVETSYNARLGLMLFAVYLAFYGGFMALSAFYPDVIRKTPLAGINLAILYGFGLIGGAVILALAYMVLCKSSASGTK